MKIEKIYLLPTAFKKINGKIFPDNIKNEQGLYILFDKDLASPLFH